MVASLAPKQREAIVVLEEKLASLRVVFLPMNDKEDENAVQFQQRIDNGLNDLRLGHRVHTVVSVHVCPLQLRLSYALRPRSALTELKLLPQRVLVLRGVATPAP